mgnify:CR=1 FL=1
MSETPDIIFPEEETQYHVNIDLHHMTKKQIGQIQMFFKENNFYWRTIGNCYYPQNVIIKECPEVYEAGDVH